MRRRSTIAVSRASACRSAARESGRIRALLTIERFAKARTGVVGLPLSLQGESDPAGVDAAARKRVELLAMKAVFEAEKALGRMPKHVSAQRGLGYDIESIDAQGNLFFIEVKG